MGQASLIRDVIFAESPPEIFSQEEAEEHQVVLLGISETCFRVWDISQNNRSEELSKHGDQSELPCLDEVKISWPFLKEIWIGTTKKKTENQPQANPSYHLHMLGVGCNNSVVSVWGADMMVRNEHGYNEWSLDQWSPLWFAARCTLQWSVW